MKDVVVARNRLQKGWRVYTYLNGGITPVVSGEIFMSKEAALVNAYEQQGDNTYLDEREYHALQGGFAMPMGEADYIKIEFEVKK